ncbi:O-antigen ligase family protein [Pallidibacillus thermolactis]|jgi:O-antigen ligase|uniref:O-antigen ligase family protein n=1 Tax=Pallidibacillus thermolactis TaxID=251051 RepID=UPI0021DA12FA|nr:O-antigen ligase family protein [Pallidibacillus thermolactis]MCU9599708.1 O-antigen ligase family protein [Pallidibacillus thermolactis subsp. kokeshiiformis]
MTNNKTLVNVNSFMIAIVLTADFISRMIAAIVGVEENIKPTLTIIAFLVSYTIVITTKYRVKFEINSLIFLYFIILTFVISFLFLGIDSYTSEYFFLFLLYGIIPFLLTRLIYSSSQVIYYTMLIGNIVLINPLAFREYIMVGETYNYVSMDATYAILPSIVATIIYILFIKRKGKMLVSIVSLLSNSFLLYIVIFEGSRGATLAIILLLLILLYIIISRKINLNLEAASIYSFCIALLFIILSILVINIQKVLYWINNLMLSFDIEMAAITKTMNFINQHGLSGVLNGRDVIYEISYGMFKESPIYGHGVGVFADLHGTYPHNLFLQLLVEGGILLTIPFILIFIFIFWYLIKPWYKGDILYKKRIFILFLFIICIPRLTFSSFLWKEQAFWLLCFFIFSVLNKRKLKINSTKYEEIKKNEVITEGSTEHVY